MSDQDARVVLDKEQPVRGFKYYENKYRQQGYTGDALWKKVIEGSKKANEEVNNSYGIEK